MVQSRYFDSGVCARTTYSEDLIVSRDNFVDVLNSFTVSTKSYSILTNHKALSYCCGSAEDSHPIPLNGQRHDVTKNLESALQRL